MQPCRMAGHLWPYRGKRSHCIGHKGVAIGVEVMFAIGVVHAAEMSERGIVADMPGEGVIVFNSIARGAEEVVVGADQHLAVKEEYCDEGCGCNCS